MGRKKRSSAAVESVGGSYGGGNAVAGGGGAVDANKKSKSSNAGESYLVKKYRAEKTYAAMEAFVRYTKAHRMLDASYVRCYKGVTPEKPYVFSTRVGGTDLGWGRGKTREAAMDCACRATFALVNAHGYKNFPVDDDCLTEEPQDLPPPPPPPVAPPLPGMMPPHGMHGFPPPPPPPLPHNLNLPPPPMGMPPLPPGLPPGAPPLPPPLPPPMPPAADLIPQPKIQMEAPVASSLSLTSKVQASGVSTSAANDSSDAATKNTTSLSLNLGGDTSGQSKAVRASSSKLLKGGLTLVFDPGMDGSEEICMEELRASLPRYQSMLRS